MAKYRITAPDGGTYEITAPDNASEQDVLSYAQGQFQAQPSSNPLQLEQPRNARGLGDSGATWGGVQQFASGLTQGLGDEIMAATAAAKESLGGGLPFGKAYDQAKAAYQAQRGKYEQESPKTAMALDVAGQVAPWLAVPMPAINAATGLGRAAQAGAMGAGMGGVSGFTNAEGDITDRLSGAGTGAALGFGLGAAAEPIAGTIQSGANKAANYMANRRLMSEAVKTAPTTDELKRAATAAYGRIKEAGVEIPKGPFGSAVDDMTQTMIDEGIDKTLHPRASAALSRVQQVMEEGDPTKITTLRQIVSDVGASNDPAERRLGQIMKGKLDDFIGGMEIGPGFKEANDLYRRYSGSKTVDDLMSAAQNRASQFSGSGMENAIRTEFRGLARNKSAMRGFSPAEQEAIKKVSAGGPLENALRMIGKAAPTGIVSGALGSGAGYTLSGGDPFYAAAVPMAGFAGRAGATVLAKRNADLARALLASGAGRGVPQVAPSPRTTVPTPLAQALIMGGLNMTDRR